MTIKHALELLRESMPENTLSKTRPNMKGNRMEQKNLRVLVTKTHIFACLSHTYYSHYFILLLLENSLRAWPVSALVCSPSSFPNTKKSRDSRERNTSLRMFKKMHGILLIETFTGLIPIWLGRLRKSKSKAAAAILPENEFGTSSRFSHSIIPCFPRLLALGKEKSRTTTFAFASYSSVNACHKNIVIDSIRWVIVLSRWSE